MTDDMDELLATDPPSGSAGLMDLEPAVWARVDALRARSGRRKARVVAVVVALGVGATNGGLMLASQPEPTEMQVFSVAAYLGPLGGLDGVG